jgi:L-threonylcarbamoyladenylate synthase
LKCGCVVAIPTETVYGLAGLALDTEACRSIFSIKGRPLVDPLIVHLPDREMARDMAEVPESFGTLTEAFWPGPLTVILKKKPLVPDLVTAGKPTVALRMPRHPAAQALLETLGAPLAAPSANPFGYVSPTRAGHVSESFGEKVPFIIDGGPCDIGLESTILDITNPAHPQILRPGALSAMDISQVLGVPVEVRKVTLHHDEAAAAPGTYSRHYSPRTSLNLFEEGEQPTPGSNEALVLLQRPKVITDREVFWLSEKGEPTMMARSLFTLLRALDGKGFETIHCELPSPAGTGIMPAVRDRLKRAAARK